ncbi:MAG: sigma-70 family RNA polymerase sigma factor [Planctomycetota bacterium]
MNDCNPPEEVPEATSDASEPFDLQQYMPYLRMLASFRMRKRLRAKIGESDIVQQTMVAAVENRDQFRGETDAEMRAWLRQILARKISHADRDLHRDRRDISREQSIDQALQQSSMRLEQMLGDGGPTPSQYAMRGERVLQLAAAIERLPNDQGDAIRMHHIEGLKLTEIAEILEKSPGAIAGLMHRGMKTLKQIVSPKSL